MPYIVEKVKGGWKLKKDQPGRPKYFSKKPFKTKKEATAQMRAIIISEQQQGNGIYDFITKVGKWVASKRKDPRMGLAIPIPGYESKYGHPQAWCGPLNDTSLSYQRDYPPATKTEQTCMYHDLEYDQALQKRKEGATTEEFNKLIADADQKMLSTLDSFTATSLPEKILKGLSYAGIRSKAWLDKLTGSGIKRKTKYGLM